MYVYFRTHKYKFTQVYTYIHTQKWIFLCPPIHVRTDIHAHRCPLPARNDTQIPRFGIEAAVHWLFASDFAGKSSLEVGVEGGEW